MAKYKVSKVTVRLPESLVKELSKSAETKNVGYTEYMRQIFEADFGHKRKERVAVERVRKNVIVSFLLPENVVSYLRKKAGILNMGYTTYIRHYLETRFGLPWS